MFRVKAGAVFTGSRTGPVAPLGGVYERQLSERPGLDQAATVGSP